MWSAWKAIRGWTAEKQKHIQEEIRRLEQEAAEAADSIARLENARAAAEAHLQALKLKRWRKQEAEEERSADLNPSGPLPKTPAGKRMSRQNAANTMP